MTDAKNNNSGHDAGTTVGAIVGALGALLTVILADNPRSFGLGLCTFLAAGLLIYGATRRDQQRRRRFIGVSAALIVATIVFAFATIPVPEDRLIGGGEFESASPENREVSPTADATPEPSDRATAAPTPMGVPEDSSEASPEATPSSDMDFLSELTPVRGGWSTSLSRSIMIGNFSIDGESYPRSIVLSSCDDPNVVEYNIGRKYDRFEASVGMTDTADSVWRSSIEFEADGDLVETVEIRVGEPSEVGFSVQDALTLTMSTTNLEDPVEIGTCQLDPIGPALGSPRLVNVPG